LPDVIPRSYSWLPTLEEFLPTHTGLELKMTDSGEFAHLFSVVDSNEEFIYKGPKILQRHFKLVKWRDETTVVSFRPARMWKIATPVLKTMSYARQVFRLLGHLWDTQGNNTRQYNMIRSCIDTSMKMMPMFADYKQMHNEYVMHFENTPIFEEFKERLKRLMGTDIDDVDLAKLSETIPSQVFLQDQFNEPDLTFNYEPVPHDWTYYQSTNRT